VRRSGAISQERRRRSGHVLQRFRASASTARAVHVNGSMSLDVQFHQAFGAHRPSCPGQEVPRACSTRADDAKVTRPRSTRKPGLRISVADREPHRRRRRHVIFGTGGHWPAASRNSARWIRGAGSSASTRPGMVTTAFPEQRDRMADIAPPAAFASHRDKDILPRKIIQKPARIGA